jgi:hypothetical protein
MTLADYLTRTRTLLRDSTGSFYSDPDLTAFITEARHVRDLDTRLVRKLVGYTLTASQASYSLATISSTGTFLFGESACVAKDILSLNVMTQGGVPGGLGYRYPLSRAAFSFFSPYVSTSWVSYPKWFQLYGFDTVIFAPIPAFAYPIEVDLVGVYPDLMSPSAVEPMPDPYNDPLPYKAAAIAKDNAQRFDEAKQFEEQYTTRMRQIRDGIRQISVSDPYAGRR